MPPEDLQQTEQQELFQGWNLLPHSHFFYDEWQYCYLEQSQLQAAPAGSGI